MKKRNHPYWKNVIFRTVLPVTITVILFFIVIFEISLPSLENNLMSSRRLMIRELTATVSELLDDYNERVKKGELTLREAQKRAELRITSLRYGPENKDYFWINDMAPTMIVHPYRQDLIGKDLSDFKDPNGKRLFLEFVKLAKDSGCGYVDYMWQWKDDSTNIVEKLSYVKLFEPWGWILGTGIYIEDVKLEVEALTHKVYIIFIIILLITFLLSIYIILHGERLQRKNIETEEALKSSEIKYSEIFNVTNEAIILFDGVDGYIREINESGKALFDLTIEYIKGKKIEEILDIYTSEVPDCTEKWLSRVKENKKSLFELNASTQSGRIFWGEVNLKLICIDDQEMMLAVIREITERKNAEVALKKSEEKYRKLVESMNDGLAAVNEAGKLLYVNPKFCEMLGYTREELLGLYTKDLLDENNQKTYDLQFTLRKNGYIDNYILTWKKKDGNKLITNISPQPMYNDYGNFDGSFAVITDITQKKLSEEEFIRFVNFKKLVMDLSADLISIPMEQIELSINNALGMLCEFTDVERSYIFIHVKKSGTFEILSSWYKDEKYHTVIRPVVDIENDKLAKAIIEGEQSLRIDNIAEINFLGESEKLYFENSNTKSILATPLLSEGEPLGFLALESVGRIRNWKQEESEIVNIVGHIITNAIIRKNSEEALVAAKVKAEKSDKLKSEFLAQISHEIRTPINTILSFSSLIREEFSEELDSDMEQSFYYMKNAGKRIIRTIDLLLNMSEIQTGTYEYKKESFDVYNNVVLNIVNEYSILAKEKNLSLNINNNTDHHDIEADLYTVTQMLGNLIDNAIKYTESGSVTVNLNRDKRKQYIIEVRDTGIGISKEYIPHLFTAFTQEEQGYTRRFEGNGLGLALVQKYCQLNNAEITVDSEKGKGSVFRILFHNT